MKVFLLLTVLSLSGLLASTAGIAQQVSPPSSPQPQPSRPQPPQPPRPPRPPQPQIQPPRPPQPSRPQPQPPRPPRPVIGYSGWRTLATVALRQPMGQASVQLNGRYTRFRYIKLKVSTMPLEMERLLVTYEYGPSVDLPVHYRLMPGSDHHIYSLQSMAGRRIQRIDFWYRSAGIFNRANLMLLGMQ